MPSALVVVACVDGGEACRRDGGAEDPADRRRVEAARVEARPRRPCPSRAIDLVAGDDRRQHLAPGSAPALAAASAAGQVTVETWLTESECVSSKSSPWQSIAFANAAFGAGSRRSVADHGRLGLAAELAPSSPGPRPRCPWRARRARSRACRAGGASRARPPRRARRRASSARRELRRMPSLLAGHRHTVQSSSVPGNVSCDLGGVALVDHERPLELDHDLAALVDAAAAHRDDADARVRLRLAQSRGSRSRPRACRPRTPGSAA